MSTQDKCIGCFDILPVVGQRFFLNSTGPYCNKCWSDLHPGFSKKLTSCNDCPRFEGDNIDRVEYADCTLHGRVREDRAGNCPDYEYVNLHHLAAIAPSPEQKAATLVELRGRDYGDPVAIWARIAARWSDILGVAVDAVQAVEMMIAMKRERQAYRPKQDNLDDIAGYELIKRMIEDA